MADDRRGGPGAPGAANSSDPSRSAGASPSVWFRPSLCGVHAAIFDREACAGHIGTVHRSLRLLPAIYLIALVFGDSLRGATPEPRDTLEKASVSWLRPLSGPWE